VNRKAALTFVVALSAPSALFAAGTVARPLGDTQVLARVSNPSFPEGIAVEGNTVYVSGPAAFGTAGKGPSSISAYDTRTGAAIGRTDILGEDLTQEHALSCLATDGDGQIYALSTQLGVVRVNPATGEQDVYATVPVLPACNAFPPGPCAPGDTACAFPPGPCVNGRCFPPGPCAPGTSGAACFPPGPCAPVAVNRGSLVNDLAFDDQGNLYITDSFQATIFRVTPGGGAAEPWYQDPRFDTSTLPGFTPGLNGIRVSPDRSKVFFDVTFGDAAGVWTLPRVDAPAPSGLVQFFAAQPFDFMDGMAFDSLGRLFVTLAGANQIQILEPTAATGGATGHAIVRFPSATANAALPVPFDNPANIAFNGRGSILVTNHAIFGNPADFAVLDTFAATLASPLAKPDFN
jgi:sugar lactone lactonase YvrE